jgi:Leo1-like protein
METSNAATAAGGSAGDQLPDEGMIATEDLFGDDEEADQAPITASSSGQPGVLDLFGEDSEEEKAMAAAKEREAAKTSTAASVPQPVPVAPAQPVNRINILGRKSVGKAVPTTEISLPPLPEPAPVADGSAGIDRIQTVRLPKTITTVTAGTVVAGGGEKVVVPRLGGLYQPDNYDEDEEKVALRQADKIGAAESIIRWRLKADGEADGAEDQTMDGPFRDVKPSTLESNARIVEWSDGSLTLHIGTASYSLHAQRNHHHSKGKGAAGSSGEGVQEQVFVKTTGLLPLTGAAAAQQGGNATKKETLLQGRHLISSRLAVRALDGRSIGMGSEIGQAIEAAAAASSSSSSSSAAAPLVAPVVSRATLAQVNLFSNPEVEKEKRIREEEELARKLEQQKRKGEIAMRGEGRRGGGRGNKGDSGFAGSSAGAAYDDEGAANLDSDEEEEEGNEVSLKKLKAGINKRAKATAAAARKQKEEEEEEEDASSSEEEEEDSDEEEGGAAAGKKRKLPPKKKKAPAKRAKKAADSDDDEENEDESSEEESDEDDSDDDDDDSSSGSDDSDEDDSEDDDDSDDSDD